MIRPVAFRIDGRELELRALSAAEAYDVAESGNWLRLFPEAVDEAGRAWLWERFEDARDPLTVRSLWRIWHGLAPRVYGVPWWSATRLAATRRVSWLSFESWAIRHAFDADAPWVAPRRMTAALMTWLASTCQKDVEWQQLQVEIQVPPEYAVYLPDAGGEGDEAVSASAFQANAPHWMTPAEPDVPAQAEEARGNPREGQEGAGAAVSEPREASAALPWTDQPVLTMDQFAQQARQWVQAQRTEPDEAGEPPPDQRG